MLHYARERINRILDEITKLKQSEFPYKHSYEALELLEDKFKKHQYVLSKPLFIEITDSVYAACSKSLYDLQIYVPIIGFISRSLDVRNAFEAYPPLLRLARKLIGNQTKLIISSEWELSPYVYHSITDLSGFVFIGLPAQESSNPFLIPLAGHELGHSVWNSKDISSIYDSKIYEKVIQELIYLRWDDYNKLYPNNKKEDIEGFNMFVKSTWFPAYTMALLQIEEIFCDFLGLFLFAESYLHAFSYLLSPGISGQRSLVYPNIIKRVEFLKNAATEFNINIPSNFESAFKSENEPVDPATKLLVSIADTVSSSFVFDLIRYLKDFIDTNKISIRNVKKVAAIEIDFNNVVPITDDYNLTDILNAGWNYYFMEDLWTRFPQIGEQEKKNILKDLILKSLEVTEIYERVGKKS